MTIKKLLGSAPNQVSFNRDLGNMAFQNSDAISVDRVFTKTVIGGRFPSTSSSAGTEFHDTGIYKYTDGLGYSSVALYDLHLIGNPNVGGSSSYFNVQYGILSVVHGWSYSAPAANQTVLGINYTSLYAPTGYNIGNMTVTPVFYDSVSGTEQSLIADADDAKKWQIRIKVSGYNTTYSSGGTSVVYLTRRASHLYGEGI